MCAHNCGKLAMDSGRWILFLSCILTTLFACLTNAQPNFTAHYCNYDLSGPSDSQFKKNLDIVASHLSSSEVSFHNFSIGQYPDKINVIALCRGDVSWDICRNCLTDAHTKLRSSDTCPVEILSAERNMGKISVGWYDECMLWYSNRYIFKTRTFMPDEFAYNLEKVPAAIAAQFDQAVRTLLNKLLELASKGDSVRKFATDTITTGPNNSITIYGLAECTPDLNMQQCRECLIGTTNKLSECCSGGKKGGRVLRPSCNFRYEIGQFYDDV